MGISMRVLPLTLFFIVHGIGLARTAEINFERDIAPIFAKHCLKCHGPLKQQGGVRFDTATGALKLGDSGEPTIVAGDSSHSQLIQRVTSLDDFTRMPPEGMQLSNAEVELLKKWIDSDALWPVHAEVAKESNELVVTAEDREHWAFRPLSQPHIPPVTTFGVARTPIDAFILSALESHGLELRATAQPHTLLRRIKMDLVGLPPTLEEQRRFESTPGYDPHAIERLIDAQLHSHHYGERWGRHWLDVARYADSHGQEGDQDRPHAFRYRDFVITAWNEDMPFDQFTRWQIAGDELAPSDPLAVAATGFLAAGPSTLLKEEPLEKEKALGRFLERMRNRYNELDDIVATLGTGMLGLTLGCARCHDHKYDAVPSRDYYRLIAAFQPGSRGDVYLGERHEIENHERQLSKWETDRNAANDAWVDWRATMAEQYSVSPKVADQELLPLLTPVQLKQWHDLKAALQAMDESKPPGLPQAFVYRDLTSAPQPTWLFPRGDFENRSNPVELGFVSVLTNSKSAEQYWDKARSSTEPIQSTFQRAALADWITDVEHGAGSLLARVIVNRVWQHHFGEGLVRTSDDFGIQGEKPSHPELLEWLAFDFVQHGWRLKRLHRQIMTSAVYLQDVDFDAECAAIDPQNRLLWRREPTRLEAEPLRDAMLFAAGNMNFEVYGPGFKPTIPKDAMVARNLQSPYQSEAATSPNVLRRSVYMFQKRVIPHPLMELFDKPGAAASCGRRQETLVAPQALALLNDPFVREQAEKFARRLIIEAPDTPSRSELALEKCLCRSPQDLEVADAVEFISGRYQSRLQREESGSTSEAYQAAVADFCQVLFGLNEFFIVD